MPVTYKFITAPEFDVKNSKVILTFEDFYRLVDLAQEHLNAPPPAPNGGQFTNAPQGGNQTVYVNKFVVDHTKQSFHFGPAQPLINQQAHLSASFANALSQVNQISHILNTTEGKRLGNTPLDCLSAKLSQFRSASLIFATRTFAPKTEVAKEFHAACDNQPNVLVIIKSGQYIAGGFTAVAFESLNDHFKPNFDGTTFVFSLNRRKVYPLRDKDNAIYCNKNFGPIFGNYDIGIRNNFANSDNYEQLYHSTSAFDNTNVVKGELFGTVYFAVDEYEVFRLK